MALIEVRPIPKTNPWHGVEDADKNFDQEKVYEVFYNSQTGKYDLNMNPEEKRRMEERLGHDLDDTFDYQRPHPYFSTRPYQIRLPNRTVFFNTDIPLEAFKVQVMKSPNFGFVANSLRAWENGDYPSATHIIYDEADEVAVKASAAQLKTDVLRYASKMTLEEKAAMIRIINGESVRIQSNDYVTVAIDEISMDKKKADEFISMVTDTNRKSALLIEGIIYQAIDKNIIIKQRGQLTFLGDVIGNDVDEVVRWLTEPQNSETKKILLDKLK
jgi:hypothetical protein